MEEPGQAHGFGGEKGGSPRIPQARHCDDSVYPSMGLGITPEVLRKLDKALVPTGPEPPENWACQEGTR